MRTYVRVSGFFLALLAGVQLVRLVMRWPIRVATVDVPLWPSAIAALLVGSLAIWAFRVASRPDSRAAG
jgi:hypothetical protein